MAIWKDWMTEKHWEGLEMLAKMPPFNGKTNVIDHMIQHNEEWDRYINKSDDNQNPKPPGPYGQYEVLNVMAKTKTMVLNERRQQELYIDDNDGVLDIDKIMEADDSDSVEDEIKNATVIRTFQNSPDLPDNSDEDENAYFKRRNNIHEDEFVS